VAGPHLLWLSVSRGARPPVVTPIPRGHGETSRPRSRGNPRRGSWDVDGAT
jgi:hypothetical protein